MQRVSEQEQDNTGYSSIVCLYASQGRLEWAGLHNVMAESQSLVACGGSYQSKVLAQQGTKASSTWSSKIKSYAIPQGRACSV